MFRIFLGLACLCVALILAEVGLGIAISRFDAHSLITVHLLTGIFAAIFICLLHTVTMFHLIGTQKDMKDASKDLPEHGEIVQAIRALKSRIFPIATLAIAVTIAAEVSGGGAHTGDWPSWIHPTLAVLALVVNAYAFAMEYIGVKANLILLNLVDYRLEHGELPKHE